MNQLVAQLFQMRVRMKNLMGVMEGGSIPALSNLEEAMKNEQKVPFCLCSMIVFIWLDVIICGQLFNFYILYAFVMKILRHADVVRWLGQIKHAAGYTLVGSNHTKFDHYKEYSKYNGHGLHIKCLILSTGSLFFQRSFMEQNKYVCYSGVLTDLSQL